MLSDRYEDSGVWSCRMSYRSCPVGGAGETECDVCTPGSSATQHDPRHDGHSSTWRDVALLL